MVDKSILMVNDYVLKPKWLCRYNNNSKARAAVSVSWAGNRFLK
jgi:hypothetical protein